MIAEFKNCEKSDFLNNGYEDSISYNVGNLLCPDVEILKDNYMLRNKYENRFDRAGVSIDIISCNDKFVDDCKNDTEIADFVSKLIFTKYYVTEEEDFSNDQKYHKRPVR